MQFDQLNRRDLITLLGGAAAWPVAARAQQPAMPVIGFLDSRLPDAIADRLRGFRQGLKDSGYMEGENVAIVYRFANNQDGRLPELAADLARRGVAVIATAGTPSTFAAKAATGTTPIVFVIGDDPVRLGLVTSLLTGKQLEIAADLVPMLPSKVGVLLNVSNPANAVQWREAVEVGGLMSYGVDILDVFRQVGVYTGQILKGAKPADLPVVQSSKFEFVINAQTARLLGIEIRLHPMARLSARPGIGNAVADDRTAVGGRLTLCERCIHTASVAARTLQTDWPFERLRKGAAEQRDAKGTGYNQTAHQSLLWSFPTSLRCVCRWTKAARSCAGNRPRQVLRHLC